MNATGMSVAASPEMPARPDLMRPSPFRAEWTDRRCWAARTHCGHRHGTHSLVGIAACSAAAYVADAYRQLTAGKIALALLLTLVIASALRALKIGGHWASRRSGRFPGGTSGCCRNRSPSPPGPARSAGSLFLSCSPRWPGWESSRPKACPWRLAPR
jgi:hypothetical protein